MQYNLESHDSRLRRVDRKDNRTSVASLETMKNGGKVSRNEPRGIKKTKKDGIL
jgi:hypothetical protein